MSSSSSSVNQVCCDSFSFHPQVLRGDFFFPFQSPNREVVEKILVSINAFGANRSLPSPRQEQSLHLVISMGEKILEALEDRRTSLLNELDLVEEEISVVKAQLEKARDLAKP